MALLAAGLNDPRHVLVVRRRCLLRSVGRLLAKDRGPRKGDESYKAKGVSQESLSFRLGLSYTHCGTGALEN